MNKAVLLVLGLIVVGLFVAFNFLKDKDPLDVFTGAFILVCVIGLSLFTVAVRRHEHHG